MITYDSVLVQLLHLVEAIPTPPPPSPRCRGRPTFYSNRLFLKALVIMIVRRLHKVHELLEVLKEPSPEMENVRELIQEGGGLPSRRTFERRLKALPQRLQEQIGCLGHHLVELVKPWATSGRASGSGLYRAWGKGGSVAQEGQRSRGSASHLHRHRGRVDQEWLARVGLWLEIAPGRYGGRSMDTAICPPYPGQHRRHYEVAPALIEGLAEQARFVLGDTHYNAENVREACSEGGRFLVASKKGPYPHTDAGVEVRRIFHKLRSVANENFNEHFKAIFEVHGQVPTRGEVATARFALGGVFVYQLGLLYRHEQGLEINRGLKSCLRAA